MNHESIGIIPLQERTWRASSLFFLWFASNMQLTTIVTGALAYTLHVPFSAAVLVILFGNLIGAAVMALHAAQGPQLNAPQMITSRAQFGLRGATLPLVLFTLMYIGFFASSSVLGGQLLTDLSHIPYSVSLILVNLLTALLVYFGHNVIGKFQEIGSYVFLFIMVFITIRLWPHDIPQVLNWHSAGSSAAAMLSLLAVVVTWQISYTPYVADYGRNLHPAVGRWKLLLFSGAGTWLSSSWMMVLGALVASTQAQAAHLSDGSSLTVGFSPPLRWLTNVVLLLGIVSVNIFNLYGSFMSWTASLANNRRSHSSNRHRRRILVYVLLVSTAISLWGQNDFLPKYSDFLSLLLYFLIPWSSINLVDFYFIRQGRYNPDALAGKIDTFKSFNWKTFAVYLFTLITEGLIWYAGKMYRPLVPLSHLAWLVGLLTSGGLYLAVNRRSFK